VATPLEFPLSGQRYKKNIKRGDRDYQEWIGAEWHFHLRLQVHRPFTSTYTQKSCYPTRL
jgi:hypothetical protein